MKEIKICKNCGKFFERNINTRKVKWIKQKHCSVECYWKNYKPIGDQNPNWRGGTIRLFCKICSKEFFVERFRLKRGVSTCSKECNKTYRKTPEFRKGASERVLEFVKKGNHNWLKRGTCPLDKRIRKCVEMRIWKKSVWKRDSFTCIGCGDKPEKLIADHIKPFALILKENSILTLEQAKQCLELWNLENGRTLCVGCHKRTNTYGVRSTARKYKKFEPTLNPAYNGGTPTLR